MPTFFGCPDENAHCCQMKNRSPPPRIQCCLGKHNKNLWTHTVPQFSPAGQVRENPGNEVDCAGPKGVRLRES